MDPTLLSNAFGYLSILCWLGAQFPQVIVNLRTKSVEGLALPFLANWLFGDITNLIGCILTHQLPFQTYLASYFVFVDLSLVAQYIYYYKPIPSASPYSPSDSSSPSPTFSPTMTLTPTAVVYSTRNLTRPTSRSRLLERSLSQLESGVRLHGYGSEGRAKSAPRSTVAGGRRFSGILSAYPPAGLLPTSDQIASGSGTIKASGSGTTKRPSVASLRLLLKEGDLKLKKSTTKTLSQERITLTEDDRATKEHDTGEVEEEEDEVSALADSFHSEISSAPGTGGRHVSWSRATAAHPKSATALSGHLTSSGVPRRDGKATDTGDSTPTQQGVSPTLQAPPLIQHQIQPLTRSQIMEPLTPTTSTSQEEELRQRSRSRGRASTRTRMYPTLTYDYASPTAPASPNQPSSSGLQPLTASDHGSGPARLVRDGVDERDEMEELEREIIQRLDTQPDSKSRSRRRSVSIVFLSVGLGALLVLGGGSSRSTSSMSLGLNSPISISTSTSTSAGIPAMVGEVLGRSGNGPPPPSFLEGEVVIQDMEDEYTPNLDEDEDGYIIMDGKSAEYRRPHEPPPLTPEEKRRIVGRISAWACTTLYLTSRLPQIWKNYTRKSVQGLSLALFVFAFLGNTFYVSSILSTPVLWEYPTDGKPEAARLVLLGQPLSSSAAVSPLATTPFNESISATLFDAPTIPVPPPPYTTPQARAFLRESLPYLLGSAGTLCFDVVIITQGIVYGRRESMEEGEEESEDEEDECEEENDGRDRDEGEDDGGMKGKGKNVDAGAMEVVRRRHTHRDDVNVGDDDG